MAKKKAKVTAEGKFPGRDKLSPELIKAADARDLEKGAEITGRKIDLVPAGRENAFGEIGTMINLDVPCKNCGVSFFYNDDAGAVCIACGTLEMA